MRVHARTQLGVVLRQGTTRSNTTSSTRRVQINFHRSIPFLCMTRVQFTTFHLKERNIQTEKTSRLCQRVRTDRSYVWQQNESLCTRAHALTLFPIKALFITIDEHFHVFRSFKISNKNTEGESEKSITSKTLCNFCIEHRNNKIKTPTSSNH